MCVNLKHFLFKQDFFSLSALFYYFFVQSNIFILFLHFRLLSSIIFRIASVINFVFLQCYVYEGCFSLVSLTLNSQHILLFNICLYYFPSMELYLFFTVTLSLFLISVSVFSNAKSSLLFYGVSIMVLYFNLISPILEHDN